MTFTPAFLDEIRARLPVSEVAGARVKLKKQGREWRGLSPFNAEKTPSFYCNDQKGFYQDFSSGKNGDIFGFLMETEGLSFPEAVERLASQAGLPMPAQTRESEAVQKQRATLNQVLELAAVFFEAQLQARAGAKARGYLADRGLPLAVQQQFRLGYAPAEKYALRDALAAKDASVEIMCEAGLLIHGEDIAVPYDRFRDRVMFPICDRAGKVIAFGGRALAADAQAKYLNSPETPLFHKGSVLYNHHNARKAAHDKGGVIAVEGYVDVIGMSMAGFSHVVAPLGTALTGEQCDLLWKMADEPILCFDGDKAGRKAAWRAIDTALPLLGPGKSLRFALLPDGQDPDDLARSGGAAAVRQVIDAAKPLVDMLFAREVEAQPLDTPERKAGLERRLRDIIKAIADDTLRSHYNDDIRARLAKLFGRGPRPPASAATRAWSPTRPQWRGKNEPDLHGGASLAPVIGASLARSALFARSTTSMMTREALILLILLHQPVLLARHAEELSGLDFGSRDARALRNGLIDLAIEPHDDYRALAEAVDAAGFAAIRHKLISHATLSAQWFVSPTAAEADAEEVLRQALTLHHKTHALHQALLTTQRALADEASDAQAVARNLARLCDIQSQLAAIEGTEAAIEGFGILSGRPSRDM